jgi:hypothetical protein
MTRRARDDPIPARHLFESSAKYPSTHITTRRASVLIAPEPAICVALSRTSVRTARVRSIRPDSKSQGNGFPPQAHRLIAGTHNLAGRHSSSTARKLPRLTMSGSVGRFGAAAFPPDRLQSPHAARKLCASYRAPPSRRPRCGPPHPLGPYSPANRPNPSSRRAQGHANETARHAGKPHAAGHQSYSRSRADGNLARGDGLGTCVPAHSGSAAA